MTTVIQGDSQDQESSNQNTNTAMDNNANNLEQHHTYRNPYNVNRLGQFFHNLAMTSKQVFHRVIGSTVDRTRHSTEQTASQGGIPTPVIPQGDESESDELPTCTTNIRDTSHVLLENEKWGDDIYHTKPSGSCRLYFQNVHGLRPNQKVEDKWIDCIKVMNYYDVDIFGFTETNVNWNNRRIKQKYNTYAKQCFTQASINYSHNRYDVDSDYLPGGALHATVKSWTGRIKRQLHDPHKMGRWTGTQYAVTEYQSLVIITLYRVGKGETMGVTSSYTQQALALSQRFGTDTHKTPRMQVLLDLQMYLESLDIQPTDYIIIMTDANETLGEDMYGLSDFMAKVNLVDLFSMHQQMDCNIATYKRSKARRIDYIIGSPSLVPYIRNCGYLPFNKGIDSDHRGLFLDLDAHIAKGHLHIASPPQRKIGFTTCKNEVHKYKQYVLSEFYKTDVVQRAQQLHNQASEQYDNDPTFMKTLNDLDDEVTTIMLQAEQTQCSKKPSIRWSAEIHNASLVIKYWTIKYRNRRTRYDLSRQLQAIYDQLSEESKVKIDLNEANARSNLRRAKKEKMEIYKLHRERVEASLNKRIQADVHFTGRDEVQLVKQYRHRKMEDKMFQYLKTVYPKQRGKGITHIEVPDKDANGQLTHDPMKAATWRAVSDPQEMVEKLIERNVKHFGQAASSPFASEPLQSVFGYCGTNEAATKFLEDGIPMIDHEDIDPGARQILGGLSDGKQSAPMTDFITYEEFWRAFKSWDEQTSTSPSGRHLGHYKSLLISDGHDHEYDEDNPNPSCVIKRVYYNIVMAALKSGNTLTRWCRSSTMMLEKNPGQPRINRLRVIHLYEADYNLLLKILWARRLVWHSHTSDKLHDAQAGSRPSNRCSDVVIRKEMNYQYARYTRTALATIDNDAKACYDRIMCNLAMLVSQYYGMSNRACKVHSKTLEAMRFTIKTAAGDSTEYYQHTPEHPIYGSGQGSCASPSLWLHISSLLLKLMDDVAQGMTFHDVIANHQRRISAEGFVDDIALFINHSLLTENNVQQLYEFVRQDINAWQQLLAGSGGKLELEKCFFYILNWTFNKYGDPIPQTMNDLHQTDGVNRVEIIDPDTRQAVRLSQKDINEDHKTLGVFKTIQGCEEQQRQALLSKSNQLALNTKLGQLTRYQARRAYSSIYMPSMLYSLVATSLSEKALQEIQSKALHAFLPAMGFEKTFPRAIVHGPRKFGGLNIGHLYTEMCVAKVGAVLAHIQAQTSLGQLMITNINWLQVHSGILQPVFQRGIPITYIHQDWFTHLLEFLHSINGSIVIDDQWVPQLERRHDDTLMDRIRESNVLTKAECRIFNNWRLFFKVTTLSDITEPDGLRLQLRYWNLGQFNHTTAIRQSRHNWPIQQQPDASTFRVWKKGLSLALHLSAAGDLRQPLGDWIVPIDKSYSDWQEYMDPNTKYVFQRQPDNTFWLYKPIKNTATRSIYSVAPEDVVSTVPSHSIPVRLTATTNHQYQVLHRHLVGYRDAPQTLASNFEEYIGTLSTWRRNLLTHWSTCSIERLQQAFDDNDILLIASDGSYCRSKHYGAYGAVVATDDDELMTIRGHAPGHNELKSSFRSEMYGLLAACVLIVEVSTYCNLNHITGKKLQFYVDSKSVIDRIERHRTQTMHIGEYTSADMDVELQVLAELMKLQQMGFIIPTLRHVKAHQDRHIPYESLSRDAQLNVQADELATSMSQNNFYNSPYESFPTTKIQLFIHNVPITAKFKECLRSAYLTQDMHEFYQHKFQWSDTVLSDIWWEAFDGAIKKLSHANRQQIQKFHTRRLHTNNRAKMFDNDQSATCMHCQDTIEDNNHILQCHNGSIERLQTRDEWCLHVYDYLSEDHTPTPVKTVLMVGIQAWLNRDQIPSVFTIIPNANVELVRAYNAQTEIGWDNLLRGKLSQQWENIIGRHISVNNIDHKSMTAERWAITFIEKLWAGVLSLWKVRNKENHGESKEQQHNKQKMKLLHEAKKLIVQSTDNIMERHTWIRKTEEELEEYSVIGLKAWINNVRTINRLWDKEICQRRQCGPIVYDPGITIIDRRIPMIRQE